MNEALIRQDAPVITTSLKIANKYGKKHAHIMRDIRNLLNKGAYVDSVDRSSYIDIKGQQRPMYNIYNNDIIEYFKFHSLSSHNDQDAKTYLAQDSNTGYTKIGKSINPGVREKTLQSEKPTISIFAVCDKDIELALHRHYGQYRIRGEWFKLSTKQINEIMLYGFRRIGN